VKSLEGANNRRVKSMNRSAVLHYLRKHGKASKAEIAQATSLSFTAIKNIMGELMGCGLLDVVGYDESSGGRKPLLYKLKRDRYFSLGVHLSVSHLQIALLDLEGTPCAYDRFDMDRDALQSGEIAGRLISCIQASIGGFGLARDKLLGVGLAVPGPLDPSAGVILAPPNMKGLHEVPIKKMMQEQLGIETHVEKDANLIALGELWQGAGQGRRNVLYLDADEGIGSGIVIDGQLYYGAHYGAGELGHGTIHIDGPRCNCGNYGCLEAVASGMAILRRAGEEIRRGADASFKAQYMEDERSVTLDTVLGAALEDDPLSNQLLLESARYVGIAAANAIHLLMPETVIVGGTLTHHYPRYFDQLKEVALNRIFPSFARHIDIRKAGLGVKGGAIGAGMLVLEQVFRRSLDDWLEPQSLG